MKYLILTVDPACTVATSVSEPDSNPPSLQTMADELTSVTGEFIFVFSLESAVHRH